MKELKITTKVELVPKTETKYVTLEEKVRMNILNLEKNLKEIRNMLNLTCETLGNCIGVSKQTISNIERHCSPLEIAKYIALRNVIDIQIDLCDTHTRNYVLMLMGEDIENYVPGNWMKEYCTYVTEERK